MHILHLNGGNTTATFPATENYAKTMLALHQPWRNLEDVMKNDIFGYFYALMKKLKEKQLGTQVQYDLAEYHYNNGYQRRPELTAAPIQTHPENMSAEDKNLEQLTSRTGNVEDSLVEHGSLSLDFGLNFEWDKQPSVIDVRISFVINSVCWMCGI